MDATMIDFDKRLNELGAHLQEASGSPLWLQRNFMEPRVNYVLRDLIKPGWTAFDVGANFGGLTVTMSRLVGPKGMVCGFEANPVIAAKCQRELLRSGAFNTQLYQGAIYKKSGSFIDLYLSENAVADSIYRKTDRSVSVQTIALDDFVAQTHLNPRFVKMDIEGAEFDALKGFEGTMSSQHPILILEQTPPDGQCMEFLFHLGYEAIDLQNYKAVCKPDDIVEGTVVTDLLYYQKDQIAGTAYANDLSSIQVETLISADFNWRDELYYCSRSMELLPGRYIAEVIFDATGDSNTMCGFWTDNDTDPIMRVHASSSSLVGFARHMVFDVSHGHTHFFFQFLDHPDHSVAIQEIRIDRIDAFTAHRPLYQVAT
ncbi:MAG: FkbM family methyltransferase [Pseudomonadota bacterium]